MTGIRMMILVGVICAVGLSGAQGVMQLTYTPSGTNTIVTAADGVTTYWEMTIDTASTRPGRIMAFIDKSGATKNDFNYAHSYSFGAGMVDPLDNGTMRDANKYTISDIVTDPTGMTYTLTQSLTHDPDPGTATKTMDWTIGLPTVTPEGYDTNIHVVDTFTFDADWVGVNADARIRAYLRLAASDNNDEYTFATHNGVTEGDPANLMVTATVTGANTDMAVGSTFTQTLTYTTFFDTYAAAVGEYGALSTPYAQCRTNLGITGAYAANPGPAGAERVYSADIDVDISIVAASGPDPLAGDIDGDGDVDLDDFVILKLAFGKDCEDPDWLTLYAAADLDDDCDVDLDDFVILKNTFGN